MLSRSVEQLYRTIQQTRTSREQLQQDHSHSQKLDRRQAQLNQDQDQDQDSHWRLKEELQTSESRHRDIQNKLVSISCSPDQNRKPVLAVLRSQRSGGVSVYFLLKR